MLLSLRTVNTLESLQQQVVRPFQVILKRPQNFLIVLLRMSQKCMRWQIKWILRFYLIHIVLMSQKGCKNLQMYLQCI